MYAFTVKAYSHHFTVTNFNYEAHRVVKEYARLFVSVEVSRSWDGTYTRTPKEIYAVRDPNQTEYRFHANTLSDFIRHCNNHGYPTECIQLVTVPMFNPPPCQMKLLDGVMLRDYQEPIKEHLLKPIPAKLVELQTGGGKTLTTLASLVDIGHRAAIVVKGMFVARWKEDLVDEKKKKLDLNDEDLIIVRGTKALRQLIAMAKEGYHHYKVVIITNKTLQNFYKYYRESLGDTSFYGCAPHELYEVLGIGVRVIDEVHMNFHLNFMQDLYTHIPTTINLSATLKSDDAFTNNIYQIMFPPESRAKVPDYIRYVNVIGLTYGLEDRRKVKFLQRGKGFYSHIVYEESLIACPRMLGRYLKMVEDVLDMYYTKDYKPGAKALIFASSVEMCTLIRDHLRQSFTCNDLDVRGGLGDKIDIRKYTNGDPYENLILPDIIVSTIGSAGTAVDIPDLVTVISTTSVSKSETCLQNLGRIRKSDRFKDVAPQFVYLICQEIPKHIEYHEKKMKTYKGRALTHTTLDLRLRV